MVPYGYVDDSANERVKQLESRVSIAEKSNRALLEEVVRLQTELRTTIKRNEELIRDERQSRVEMENNLRMSSEMLTQLNVRLQMTEDRLSEERSAVNSIVNQQKHVLRGRAGLSGNDGPQLDGTLGPRPDTQSNSPSFA